MKRRKLGSTGIQVSEIGLGTWEISGDVWGKKDDEESIRALNVGLDLGANFIDTAAGYGKGHAEELVGRVLRNRPADRDGVVISTKVLPQCGVFAPPPHRLIRDFYPPDWIKTQCENSLRRLQRDHIDVLFLHTWSRSWGADTEWYDAMSTLKAEGKIRAIGISIPDEGITDANVHIATGRVDVVQCVYNIFQQEPEYSLFPLADAHGVGVIARSPFSSGALIGNWTMSMTFPDGDWRGLWPKSVKDHWLEEQVEMADRVKQVLSKHGTTVPGAALEYVLRNPNVSCVIPGSADPRHVEANMNVAQHSRLPDDGASELRKLWVEGLIHGTYNGSI